MVIVAMKLKDAYSLRGNYDQLREHIKKQKHYFRNNICLVQAMVFPVVMYGCESWTIKELRAEELMLLTRGSGEDS